LSGRTRVGLLSCRNHPLLPALITRVAALPGVEPFLLFDERGLSARQLALIARRTGGAAMASGTMAVSGIPQRTVPDHNGPESVRCVQEEGLELLLNAGTPRIIGSALLSAPPRGILNVHPGILPKYRGASACEWAIYNDDPVGVSAHFMDAGLDSGPILFTRRLEVAAGWTYPRVRTALYRLAQEACAEAVEEVVRTGVRPEQLPPQAEGQVWKPIPDDLLAEVRRKLEEGRYGARAL
jgi:folate-dependent phosphoribosylglycinamide formyltransferase PurN